MLQSMGVAHVNDYGAVDGYGASVTDVAEPTRLATWKGLCS